MEPSPIEPKNIPNKKNIIDKILEAINLGTELKTQLEKNPELSKDKPLLKENIDKIKAAYTEISLALGKCLPESSQPQKTQEIPGKKYFLNRKKQKKKKKMKKK